MLVQVWQFLVGHQAPLWGILFGLSELLGLASKGGVLKMIADFVASKAKGPQA